MRRSVFVIQENRPVTRITQTRDSSCEVIETRSEEWSSTGFVSNGACWSSIDAGEWDRERPFIGFPRDNIVGRVTKIETVVERTPFVTGFKNGFPVRERQDYGIDKNNRWGNLLSPPPDRPPIVDEFITKIQTEVSRPRKMGLENRPGRTDAGTDGLNRPGNTISPPEANGAREPTMSSTGGWPRPSRVGWAAPPSRDRFHSKPTNDISTSFDNSKQAFDSGEAAWRCGGASASPEVAETYSSVIDSREAARKYCGQSI